MKRERPPAGTGGQEAADEALLSLAIIPPGHDTAYDRLLDQLDGVRRSGNRATARCPAHDDGSPSLSVTKIEGSVLVHCHAGCNTTDVLAKVDLAERDLYDDSRHGVTYRYDDGRIVHRTPNKSFPQSGNKNGRATLYRLGKVKAAVTAGEPIFLVEGEKDVHAIEALGEVATTAPMGAENVDKCDLSPLHGGQIIAIVDDDPKGETWAQKVQAALAGTAESLNFAKAKTGKDAADHIAAGHTLDEIVPWLPPEPEPVHDHREDQVDVDRRFLELRGQLLNLDGLRNLPPPTPLVDGYLFRDSLAWLGGKPGHAKTFVAVELACCVGTGTPWHGHAVTQGRVLYLIAEGASGLALRVDAWVLANGQQLKNVVFLPVPVRMMQAVDVAAFGQLLAERQPDLVILDTQARVTVGAEENSSRDMGVFVDSLDQLRRQSGACILTAHHEPRNGENLRGSTALEGAATTILRTNKDGNIVTLTNPKQKDATEQPPMLLALTPIGDSAVLSHEAVGLLGFTTESEHHVLTVLRDSFGTSGATKTELKEAADLAKSTWHRTINTLVNKGLVSSRKEGRSVIYSLPTSEQQPLVP